MILRKCAATHTRLGHMDKNRIACEAARSISSTVRTRFIRVYRSGQSVPAYPIISWLRLA